MRPIRRVPAVAAVLCLAALAMVGRGLAQGRGDGENPGGIRLTFGVSASLRADDNIDLDFGSPDDAVRQDIRLSFGIASQTQTQSFAVDLDGGLLFDSRRNGGSLDDPRASLRYDRETASSRFGFDAQYRSTQLDSADPLQLLDTLNPDDPLFQDVTLARNTGERILTTAALRYETGIDAPFGLILDADTRRREYSGTDNADLFDTEATTIGGTGLLRFSPVTTARINLSQEEYSANDPEDTARSTRDIGIGLNQRAGPALTLDANLGLSTIDTTETLGGVRRSRSSDGTIAGFSATQSLVNGQIGANFQRRFGVNGERDTLTLRRNLDLPRGSLSASLGATRGQSGNAEAVASLDYAQSLLRGSIGATLERDVTTNTTDDDVLATRAGLNYSTGLGALSRLSLALDYAQTETAGSGSGVGVVPRERTTFSATYSRDLTQDVQLSARYQHRIRTEADDTARGNSVSLTLSRRFDLRP